jgi:replicative DNA helicase
VDIERALLSKALATGELAELVARGIEYDHFADEDLGDLYDWATDVMAKHVHPPSMAASREEFPDFKPLLTKDPLSWHIERFVRRVKERMAVELVRNYHDQLEDPNEIDEIELRALEMARQLTEVVPSPKARRFSEGKARKEEYERRKKKDIIHGIPLGIPTFDKLTLGTQPHELVIWGGPPGGGKTTGLQYSSMHGYMHGETVLFVSLEVEAEQILRKFDTMLTNIRYHALKALDLNPDEEEKWHEILERAEEEKAHRDIIIVDDIRNCTVDKVAAQQIRYKPGLVVVDYLEEMRTPRNVAGWEGVAANGRGLKQQARTTRTPYITATQLNREGETAYQSAQKIADMLIVLVPPDEDDEDPTTMKLLLRKYRDGPSRKTVNMHWDLNIMDIHEADATTNGRFAPRKLGDLKKQKINPWTAKAGR